MNKPLTGATVGIAGAAFMYFLDPVLGKRRRAELRDKAVHLSRVSTRALDTTARDARHRVQGVIAEGMQMFRSDEVIDEILVERVRSAIGRVASHPSSLEVSVSDGQVTLSGPVLDDEYDRLLHRIRRVRGVQSIQDKLQPQKGQGREAGLQGGTERMERSELMQTSWAPAPRAVAIMVGLGAILFGASRRTIPGTLLAGAGATLFVRGITNLGLKRLVGINGGRRIDTAIGSHEVKWRRVD